jgi:hypothetical protein
MFRQLGLPHNERHGTQSRPHGRLIECQSIFRDFSMRLQFRCLLSTVLLIATGTNLATAIDEFGDLKTLSVLPQTQREVETAFSRSSSDACEQIGQGEPLEIRSFMRYLTERDRLSTAQRPLASARHSLFSVGLEFEASDRAALPKVSGGIIADYLEKNCVLIQGRVRRDLLDRELYFHHRPLVVTAQYRGSRLTEPFEPLVASKVRDFHGLGLFVPETRILKAEKLRTLVLIFKNDILQPFSSRTREQYEFALIRGRSSAASDQLENHVFVTTDDRQTLNYLAPYSQPLRPSQSSILGRIAVTDYDSSGIYPKESATRSFKVDTRNKFALDELDAYCLEQQLAGGFHANVTQILDAIIDKQLEPQR